MRGALVWLSLLRATAALAGTPPHIASSPSTFAVLAQPYHYDDRNQAVATGSTPITWSAVAPAGFTVGGATGAIAWTPSAAGDVMIQLVATNAYGADSQAYTVHVAGPPTITSTPTLVAKVGAPYLYGADGTIHAAGDPPLTFAAASAPPGFVVDVQTGRITFTPASAGAFTVVLAATNPYGTTTQPFTLTVAAGVGTPPVLARTANPSAAVGLPYVYDPTHGLSVTAGDPPIFYSKVSGPSGLFVDPASGAIAWIPAAAGAQAITVQAANQAGSDQYSFSVNVASGVTAQPTAAITASPLSGEAPLAVMFSSASSQAGAGATLLATEWDFGDGSPPSLAAAPAHTFLSGGSFNTRLTVTNGWGATATADTVITATLGGQSPPRAHAVASATSGTDLLAVSFTCDCAAGSNPIAAVLWDFADGNQASAQDPTHTFLPGNWRVHLVVSDTAGLSSEDTIQIAVSAGSQLPPIAYAYASPPVGPAPLVVALLATARARDGYIKQLEWDFGDGTQAAAVDRVQKTFAQPGTYQIALTAISDNGLSAVDHVTVIATASDAVPPQILSVPSRVAYVGVPYRYDQTGLPSARGSRPLTWSVGSNPPPGLTVHRDTGEIRWTPTETGDVTLTLTATNAAASASQTFTVGVQPASAAPRSGCAVGGATLRPALTLLLALALLALLGRRALGGPR